MKPHTLNLNHRLGPRLGLFVLVIAGVIGLVLFSGPGTSEAAQTVTLNPGIKLTVIPNACLLSIAKANVNNVKVSCTAFTPTATNTPTETATATATATSTATEPSAPLPYDSVTAFELASAPELKRTLVAGKNLKVVPNGCELQVKKNTPNKVAVYCKPLPTSTPTPTVTRTPTSAGPTPVPPEDGNWYGVTDENMPVWFKVEYDGEIINNFFLRYDAPACDPYFINSGNTLINNNRFQIKITYSGQGQPSQVNGIFQSTTTVVGTYDITYTTGSVCGPYDKQGTWSASKQ